MNRILEFSPSQEEAVVARILVLVHQAVDEHFPAAEQATRQFTKTVFSGEGERTAGVRAAPDGHDQFGSDEATSPDGRPSSSESEKPFIPPPPPHRPAATGQMSAPPTRTDTAPSDRLPHNSAANPLQIGKTDQGLSRSTRLDATMDEMRASMGLDWTMRITIAAFIAGLILLAYFLWKFFTLT